jgi:hypothetical protein
VTCNGIKKIIFYNVQISYLVIMFLFHLDSFRILFLFLFSLESRFGISLSDVSVVTCEAIEPHARVSHP